jgi:hypothetical protein
MKNKTFLYLPLIFLVFLGLIFFNYSIAQKNLKNTSSSQFNINIIKAPNETKAGDRNQFVYEVIADNSFSTSTTTIYWSEHSSPSALTKNDSPLAAGYERSLPDYQNGNFRLPETFDLGIIFDLPGTIYYRAYAKIGEDHYWTDEKKLYVH